MQHRHNMIWKQGYRNFVKIQDIVYGLDMLTRIKKTILHINAECL